MKQRTGYRKGVLGVAPLALFWVHVGKEKTLGRTLAKNEFDPGLWTWAGSYLKQDPAAF